MRTSDLKLRVPLHPFYEEPEQDATMKMNPNLRPPFIVDADGTLVFRTELMAAYERIKELEGALAEMVGVYWGSGDNIDPPPACIQRALAALSEEVR